MNGKRFSETVDFTKKEAQGLAKLATDQNTCVEEVIRRAVFQYLYDCYPDLKGWRIPRSLFVTLAIPEVVHKKLKLWATLKHKMNVSVDEHGILILDETGLKEHSEEQRFVLLKVPGAWEKEMKEHKLECFGDANTSDTCMQCKDNTECANETTAAAETGPTEVSP